MAKNVQILEDWQNKTITDFKKVLEQNSPRGILQLPNLRKYSKRKHLDITTTTFHNNWTLFEKDFSSLRGMKQTINKLLPEAQRGRSLPRTSAGAPSSPDRSSPFPAVSVRVGSRQKRQVNPWQIDELEVSGNMKPIDLRGRDVLSPISLKRGGAARFDFLASEGLAGNATICAATHQKRGSSPIINTSPPKKSDTSVMLKQKLSTTLPIVPKRPVRLEPSIFEQERRRQQQETMRGLIQPLLAGTLRKTVLKSFGVSIADSTAPFRYYIGRGNNSGLIKRAFIHRRGWVKTTTKENAHFVWMQWKSNSLLQDLATPGTAPAQCERPKRTFKSLYKLASAKVVDQELHRSGITLISDSGLYHALQTSVTLTPMYVKACNKLEGNYHLTDKKNLLLSMSEYYAALGQNVFTRLPVTFHIRANCAASSLAQIAEYTKTHRNAVWIVKPGEHSNRGHGISLCTGEESLAQLVAAAGNKSLIIQRYITNPLLINRRKFDIRCFALAISCNGVLQAYFYQEGYVRTSSREFSLANLGDKAVHLTNDAIQQKLDDYGKYEGFNKLSYQELARYLEHATDLEDQIFFTKVLPSIRQMVRDTFCATVGRLEGSGKQIQFEVFGYDFMIDSTGHVWLIEVNTNPCLDTSCPLLSRIIPRMIENALWLVVDTFWGNSGQCTSPGFGSSRGVRISENQFELVFNSIVDKPVVAFGCSEPENVSGNESEVSNSDSESDLEPPC